MAAFKLLWSYDNWNTHSSLTLPDEDARDRRMMRLSQIADCDVAFRIEDVAAVSAAAANGGAGSAAVGGERTSGKNKVRPPPEDDDESDDDAADDAAAAAPNKSKKKKKRAVAEESQQGESQEDVTAVTAVRFEDLRESRRKKVEKACSKVFINAEDVFKHAVEICSADSKKPLSRDDKPIQWKAAWFYVKQALEKWITEFLTDLPSSAKMKFGLTTDVNRLAVGDSNPNYKPCKGWQMAHTRVIAFGNGSIDDAYPWGLSNDCHKGLEKKAINLCWKLLGREKDDPADPRKRCKNKNAGGGGNTAKSVAGMAKIFFLYVQVWMPAPANAVAAAVASKAGSSSSDPLKIDVDEEEEGGDSDSSPMVSPRKSGPGASRAGASPQTTETKRPPPMKQCPKCTERVPSAKGRCTRCNHNFAAAKAAKLIEEEEEEELSNESDDEEDGYDDEDGDVDEDDDDEYDDEDEDYSDDEDYDSD